MLHGKVADVTTRNVGAEVVVGSTGTLVQVDNAAPFDVTGGSVILDGAVIPYLSADPDADTLTLVDATTVLEGDRLEADPALSETTVSVIVDEEGESVTARAPHSMKARLVDGIRDDPAAAETVELTWSGSDLVVSDVLSQPPLEVWGNPVGAAAEMSETGLSLYTVGPNGRYEATRLGSGQDRLGVFNAEGQIVGGVTADGHLVGQSGVVAGDFAVGGVPLLGRLWDNTPGAPAGWLERLSAGAVARRKFGDQKPSSTTFFPTGEEWGYAKLGVTARAGRTYLVTVIMQVIPGTTGGGVRTRLRYTTDGSEPSISSTQLAWATTHSPYAGNTIMTTVMIGSTAFTVDTDWRVLASVEGIGGATPRIVEAEFIVEDMGPQGTYGGGTYTTGREATPPPTVREYTTTWAATGFRVYDESEQPVTGATEPRQYGVPAGRRDYTAILFDGAAAHGSHAGETMTSATTGATITKAEVFLANTSWGGLDSGRIALGKGSLTALPPTLAPQATVHPSAPTGAGGWIEVPPSWFSDTNRVVTLGDDDVDGGIGGGWFMGPADDFPPQVRLTYAR